jgi:hypothetical protein
MKLLCINENGWYIHEGNYFGFCGSGYISETAGPQYGQEYHATGSFVDRLGDLCYYLQEFPGFGWEADSFVIADESKSLKAKLLNKQNPHI